MDVRSSQNDGSLGACLVAIFESAVAVARLLNIPMEVRLGGMWIRYKLPKLSVKLSNFSVFCCRKLVRCLLRHLSSSRKWTLVCVYLVFVLSSTCLCCCKYCFRLRGAIDMIHRLEAMILFAVSDGVKHEFGCCYYNDVNYIAMNYVLCGV